MCSPTKYLDRDNIIWQLGALSVGAVCRRLNRCGAKSATYVLTWNTLIGTPFSVDLIVIRSFL
jgi:hypothetical protein